MVSVKMAPGEFVIGPPTSCQVKSFRSLLYCTSYVRPGSVAHSKVIEPGDERVTPVIWTLPGLVTETWIVSSALRFGEPLSVTRMVSE